MESKGLKIKMKKTKAITFGRGLSKKVISAIHVQYVGRE